MFIMHFVVKVAQMYMELYQSSFDADSDSLLLLHIMQRLNSGISMCIGNICPN